MSTKLGVWRRVAGVLSLVALALGAAACGSSDSNGTDTDGSSARSPEDITVGYANPFADQFQLTEQELAIEEVKARGMKALQPVSADHDAGKQITGIRNLVSQGADAIMVTPVDSSAIKPALDFLASKDIPAISIDIGPKDAKVAMVVRADNVKMGEDACKKIGQLLDGKGTVLAMQGDYKTTNGRDRGDGFDNCMKEEFPDITVNDQQTDWNSQKAATIANTVLRTDKDVDAVFMASDTVMLSPVLSALKAAGRDARAGEPGHVSLVSIDGSPFSLRMVRAGMLDAVLSQPLNLYAKYGVMYVQQALEGKQFRPGPTDHDSEIVMDGGNLQDSLPAPLVTKENASDPSLWGNSVN